MADKVLLLVVLCELGSLGLATDNNLVGINWSPFHNPNYDSSDEDAIIAVIEEDFSRIAEQGFDYVRTFYSKHGSFGVQLAPYAEKYGLKLALGVRMYAGYDSWTTKQMTAAAEQARDYYPDVVTAIFMGNENVYKDGTGDYDADTLITWIEEMKSMLESDEYNVPNIPVGTVQRYTEWNSNQEDIDAIAAVCDILGANIYPFYVDIDFDRNIEKFESMLSNVQGYYPDHEIWITETGFPSGGTVCSATQEGTVEKTESYFNSIKDWAQENSGYNVFYFQYFDKETADEQDDICNNFFGLADAEGNLKFDI